MKKCSNCIMTNEYYYSKDGCSTCSFDDNGHRAPVKEGNDNYLKIEAVKKIEGSK